MRHLLIAALLATASCGGPTEEKASAQCPPGITIIDAWTKSARAGQPVSAAYLTICNGTDTDDALVGIAGIGEKFADSVEIHQSTMTDGVMSMARVDRIPLPAGSKTSFAPGGAHLMLIGVTRDIAAGAEPSFRLDLEKAEEIHRAFEIRDGETDHDGHH